MKIELIVPIIVDYLFYGFLESVEANTVLPQRILLIDNTPDQNFRVKSSKVKIDKLHSKTGKVNESWNLGVRHVSPDCDLVGIYNDDVVLNPCFFQRLTETFDWDDRCAVACPNTVPVEQSLKRGRVNRIKMQTREGWCFTIRKRVLDLIPPIPDNELIQFHGDDFFWYHTHERGFFWGKDLGNPIWHYKGISVLATGERLRKRPDFWAWKQIRATMK